MARLGASATHAPITTTEALDALVRSGYLLESRVESVLRAAEFRVETNTLVPDPSGTRRELDLWAGWARCYEFGPERRGTISLELVIECVNSPQPVAFITKDRAEPFFERTDRWDALKLVGNPPEIENSPHRMWTWLESELGLKRYHHYNAKRVSTQYCSCQKKQGSAQWMALHRDEDHQSFRKLCFSTDHFIRECIVPSYNPDGGWGLTVIYPLLVVQGDLYDVRPSIRSARIVRSQHVQYCCTQDVSGEENSYQIDVITERYLPRFLEIVFRELRLMHKRLDAKFDKLDEFRRLRGRNMREYLASKAQNGTVRADPRGAI